MLRLAVGGRAVVWGQSCVNRRAPDGANVVQQLALTTRTRGSATAPPRTRSAATMWMAAKVADLAELVASRSQWPRVVCDGVAA
jgi:hypothetical protein